MGMGSHLNIIQKQQAIQLHVRGFNNSQIGKQLKCHRSTISILVNDWRKTKFINIKPRRTRKRKLTAQQVYKVLRYFINSPFHTYAECIKDLKLLVSERTVGRVLAGNGVKNYVACSKQFLSLINQIKRLKFALKYQHWTTEWLQVTFSCFLRTHYKMLLNITGWLYGREDHTNVPERTCFSET